MSEENINYNYEIFSILSECNKNSREKLIAPSW